jgi:hypothetical protein
VLRFLSQNSLPGKPLFALSAPPSGMNIAMSISVEIG